MAIGIVASSKMGAFLTAGGQEALGNAVTQLAGFLTVAISFITPMNAIMGMAAIAQSNIDSPEKIRDCLNKIGTSSRHLLSLINEVLDMSKIESGKIDLNPEKVNLPDMIQNITDICRPLVIEKKLEFQISIGQVRHENIVADGDRLQQILMNLLSNAIKYTPEQGRIILRINELYSPSPGKSQYEFICIDSGIGISEEFIPRIFEPFTRAEDPRISKLQGTGLGMTITENIVRMMNGSIDVQSELGKGSRFTVSVPLELCLEKEEYGDELSGLPVLVVDDDKITCESAAALLDELGMRGHWVMSGREAVHLIVKAHEEKDDFFAVILDWKMPEMDGLETLKVIRRKLGMDVPIIVISAYDYSEIEEEFRLAGADAFITKPLFRSKVAHTFHQFCQSGRSDAVAIPIEEVHTSLEGKRILLVEDNPLNREIAAELLKMHGFLIDEAENGRIALEKFLASEPGGYDCILMDIQMPVMDGWTASVKIRELDRQDVRTIPIIAMTANAFADDRQKTTESGMNEHLAKPIDIPQLYQILDRFL